MECNNLSKIKQQLRKLGVVPRKGKGQNFLFSSQFVDEALAFASVSTEDTVLEIGPGLGVLTGGLIERSSDYYCVEVESAFCEHIVKRFSTLDKSRVFCTDVRKFALNQIVRENERILVVSNVPYSLSSEIVLWLVDNRQYVKRANLLLQREFAERLAASPNSKAYGRLSVVAQLYGSARLGPVVPGDSFFPSANVESRFVELTLSPDPREPTENEGIFRNVVKEAFSVRRKTLANALGQSGRLGSKAEIITILQQVGIEPSRRAETLTIREFALLANAFTDENNLCDLV